MLWLTLLLALSVSIDAVGIGITYGVRGIGITKKAQGVIILLSLCMTGLASLAGSLLAHLLPQAVATRIGCVLLFFMGLFLLCQSFSKKEKKEEILDLSIKPLGITVKIMRNPEQCDFDRSNAIETHEALYLGVALSLDGVSAALAAAASGVAGWFFSCLVAAFQLLCLLCGKKLGAALAAASQLPSTVWNRISGAVFILIGLVRLFAC